MYISAQSRYLEPSHVLSQIKYKGVFFDMAVKKNKKNQKQIKDVESPTLNNKVYHFQNSNKVTMILLTMR